jgi:hypothetical protein
MNMHSQWKQCPWTNNQTINVPMESACPTIKQPVYTPGSVRIPPAGPSPVIKPVYTLAPASGKVVVPYSIIDPLEPFVPMIPEIVQGPVNNVCDFGSSFYCLASQYNNSGRSVLLAEHTQAIERPTHKAAHYVAPRAFSNELNVRNESYDPAYLAGPVDASKFAQYASAHNGQADFAMGLNPKSEMKPFSLQPGQTF